MSMIGRLHKKPIKHRAADWRHRVAEDAPTGPLDEALRTAYGQVRAQQDAWHSEPEPDWIDRSSNATAECTPDVKPHRRWISRQRTLRAASAAGDFALRMAPAFFLSFADLLGMPSGLHIAYLVACGSCGASMLPGLVGTAAAIGMRLYWRIPVYWFLCISAALAVGAGRLVRGRQNAWIMAAVGAALMPLVAWGVIYGSAEEELLCMASLLISALSAPVMLRAISTVRSGRCFNSLDVRVAIGWLLGLMVSGGGRMLVGSLNVGVLLSAVLTCGMAMYCDVTAAMITGLCGGMALSMMALAPSLAVCMALGGLMAGLARSLERRWLTCLGFAGTVAAMMSVSGATGMGCLEAALAAPLLLLLLRGDPGQAAQRFFHRFLNSEPMQGDTYASQTLGAWRQTMGDMAKAVPSPRQEMAERDPAWWRRHLCADCPDAAQCETMLSDMACQRAEEIWQLRGGEDEEWQQALEGLRGLGCGRLYCLRSGMDHLRTEEAIHASWVKRACFQRDMLVTHLEAISDAAMRFSQLSACASWWDEATASRLKQRVSETALPVQVQYVRRVGGHAAVSLELLHPGSGKSYANDACRLCSEVLNVRMAVDVLAEDKLILRERPVYAVCVGVSGDGRGKVTGDAACTCRLSDGRLMAALSDGMGQGQRAGEESSLTVNLLRLCMEAGYSRTQTLTAVNGMMLLETGGERFATADLVTIDLWNGEATLDKLGSAGSWLMRGSTLAELTGDALPIGILETIESRSSIVRLRPGDRMLLMTDGVEDAFEDRAALEEAIHDALREPYAQDAAELLLHTAQRAGANRTPDDRTVLVLQVEKAG